ncbi:MAG TPA: T9SS type A sorting domain-containing protein [Candidatus Cloacimonadota bacterium]|nr:T9SS type A sorting domain-containing protein [Candidatus Cloacimonadota bacterium]
MVVQKTRMLQGNYPNPFNPTTTIAYQLTKSQPVNITVYNAKGQKVRNLLNSVITAGNHTVVWNGMDDHGKSVSSGIYYYRLSTADHSEVRKAILMK